MASILEIKHLEINKIYNTDSVKIFVWPTLYRIMAILSALRFNYKQTKYIVSSFFRCDFGVL